jgi:hypothetical protein
LSLLREFAMRLAARRIIQGTHPNASDLKEFGP